MASYTGALEATFWLVAGSRVISALAVWLLAEETLPRLNPAAAESLQHQGLAMKHRALLPTLALAFSILLAPAAPAADNPAVLKDVEEYMDFTEYGSSLIWPEQIPEEDWKRVFVVDARDAAQYAKDHIPGAVNIEWRQAVARRGELPRDRMVVVYCNSGSLSAQAVFALRLLGWDNVKVLQDGFEGWKAKGGFEANRRAMKAAGH